MLQRCMLQQFHLTQYFRPPFMATQWLSVLVGQFVFFPSLILMFWYIGLSYLNVALTTMHHLYTVWSLYVCAFWNWCSGWCCSILLWAIRLWHFWRCFVTFYVGFLIVLWCFLTLWHFWRCFVTFCVEFLKMFWHFWRYFVTFCVGFLIVLWCFLRAESRRCNMCSFNLTSINSKNLPVYNQLLGR